MIKTYIIEPGQKPTEAQLEEVKEAKKYPIIFDEDCKEISPTMAKALRSAALQRNRRNNIENA